MLARDRSVLNRGVWFYVTLPEVKMWPVWYGKKKSDCKTVNAVEPLE